MKLKSKKSALLLSFTSLLLCFAMLVGSTFAWFTDTASTGVNKIQAGNLDVELEYKKRGDTGFAKANENTKVFEEAAQWEPNHLEYVVLKVSNAGNLALKYKLGINIANEVSGRSVIDDKVFKLSDYINFSVVEGDKSELTREQLIAAVREWKKLGEGYMTEDTPLYPAGKEAPSEKTVTLVVWMPESVGNEANHKAETTAPYVELGINVVATQYTYEKDSFSDQYDKDATYPVASAADMKKALEEINDSETVNSAVLALNQDFTYDDAQLQVGSGKNITIDLAGNDLTITNTTGDGFTIDNGGTLTLGNSGTGGTYIFDCEASGSDGIFVSNTEEGKTAALNITGDVQINVGANANSAIHAYAAKGNAEINIDGATIKMNGTEQTSAIVVDQNSTLNIQNATMELNADFDSYSDGNDVVGILLWGQNGKQENITVNIGENTTFKVGGKNAFAQGIQIGMKNGYSQNVQVNIDGANIELAPTENGKGYAFTTYKDVYGKFVMNSGTVSGKIDALGLAYIGGVDLTINGGTFSVDPTQYVNSATHTVNENNGTYTVTAK